MSRAQESGVDAASVTPNDNANLPNNADRPVRAVWIGGAGNLRVDMTNGTDVTFVGCLAGSLIPISVKKVYATGTSATSIVAVY